MIVRGKSGTKAEMIGVGLRKVNFTVERVGIFSPKVKIRVTRGYSFECTPKDFATLQASNVPYVLGSLKGFEYWFYRGGVLKADRHYDNEEIRLLLWDKEQREQSKLGRLQRDEDRRRIWHYSYPRWKSRVDPRRYPCICLATRHGEV